MATAGIPRAVFLDTETTGFDEPEVVELATSTPFVWGASEKVRVEVKRFRPNRAISNGAMAVHHIILEDLRDCVPWPGKMELPQGADYLIGHNIDYDWKALGCPPCKRICTLALARWLYPSPATDSHALAAMMFHLFDPSVARNLARSAHTAERDVQMTRLLLEEMIGDLRAGTSGRSVGCPLGFEDLWRLSEHARIPERLTFGKHGPKDGKPGALYSEVPTDYLQWMQRQSGEDAFDEFVLQAVRRELRARFPRG